MYQRYGFAYTSYNPPWSPFRKGGMLDSPPLKKGDLGGLSVRADKELSSPTGKGIL
jgi:hypothetical protein